MPKKIFIVDDDQAMVHTLKELLQKNGYEVLAASDGAQAVHLVKTHAFDLLIVDLKMPDLDGWHFIMKIRQNDQYKTTPIIVLSALLEHDAEPEKFELLNAYVVKPFDSTKLIEKIKDLLSGTKGS